MSALPPEIQNIIEQVLSEWKIKQGRIRFPLQVTMQEAKEIINLLEKLRS